MKDAERALDAEKAAVIAARGAYDESEAEEAKELET